MHRPLICLTMIVKNEAENIERCLRSAIGHIDAIAIVDTGSTDGTEDIIRDVASHFPDIECTIEVAVFENFSQARNLSLDLAERILITRGSDVHVSRYPAEWFLLLDADMTLECYEGLHDVLAKANRQYQHKPDAYHIMQQTPHEMVYPNIRLVRRGVEARYEGSTHEAISVENKLAPLLDDVRIIDHETGSNRKEKFDRDVRLLEADLRSDPENTRTIFYLAESYAGRSHEGDIAKAAFLFRHRAAMEGTWEEERWLAKLYEARQYLRLGRDGEFMFTAFDAWQMNPERAEPLYDLAVYFRKKKMYEPARVMAAKGLELEKPTHMMFLEGAVYSWALREEYVISASMAKNSLYRQRGAVLCNQLALDHNVSLDTRYAARNNLLGFADRLYKPCPSFQKHPVRFMPPDGYSCGVPCIISVGDGFVMAQRTVNYEIKVLPTGDIIFPTRDGGPVNSRIFLLWLDRYFNIIDEYELAPPDGLQTSSRITGLEDPRLSKIGDEIYVTGMSVAPKPYEMCRMVFGRIDIKLRKVVDWRLLPSPEKHDEKNWMPFVKDGKIGWIYHCKNSSVLDENVNVVKTSKPPFNAEAMCGGSPLMEFGGGYLAVIHEHVINPENKSRAYLHRFVWFDSEVSLKKCSPPFIIERKGIEYISGLTSKDEGRTLVLSYHVNDEISWIATVSATDVRVLLG